MLIGGAGSDHLVGGTGNNHLFGDDGSDFLVGGIAIDVMVGGADGDVLFGNLSRDIMWGGTGADTFEFRSLLDSGVGAEARDRIMDWEAGDRIDLRFIDADGNGNNGNQAFSFVGLEDFSAAGQVRYFLNSSGHTVVQVNADSDASTIEFEIELNGAKVPLTGSDFFL